QLFGARADAALHLGAEMTDQALDRPGGAIRQGADRMALDLLAHILKHIDLLDASVARDHAFHDTPHPAQAFATGRALAATLVLGELGEPGDRLHDVGRLVHDDDGSRAEPGS